MSRTLRSMNATLFSTDSRSMVRRVCRSNGLTLRGGDPARPSQMNDVFGRGLSLRDRRLRLVAGARDAVVLVEALLRRVPVLRAVTAEMPLAEQARGVADRLQRFRDRHFPQRDAGGLRRAGPDGVTSGHQRRARDRAGKLDVEVVEPESFGRQPIEARRDRAAHAAVDVHLAPSQVVGKHQDDVGPGGRSGLLARDAERAEPQDEARAGDDREHPLRSPGARAIPARLLTTPSFRIARRYGCSSTFPAASATVTSRLSPARKLLAPTFSSAVSFEKTRRSAGHDAHRRPWRVGVGQFLRDDTVDCREIDRGPFDAARGRRLRLHARGEQVDDHNRDQQQAGSERAWILRFSQRDGQMVTEGTRIRKVPGMRPRCRPGRSGPGDARRAWSVVGCRCQRAAEELALRRREEQRTAGRDGNAHLRRHQSVARMRSARQQEVADLVGDDVAEQECRLGVCRSRSPRADGTGPSRSGLPAAPCRRPHRERRSDRPSPPSRD